MELGAREGLMGLFHSGIEWRALMSLVDPKRLVVVKREKSLPVGDRRLVPDLVVRCARTDKVLLVVEVWHTHAVTPRKKAAFLAAGYPWIEVRSWHVISRTRKKPLPILDWGGPGLPNGPEQLALFTHPPIANGGTSMIHAASLPARSNVRSPHPRAYSSLQGAYTSCQASAGQPPDRGS